MTAALRKELGLHVNILKLKAKPLDAVNWKVTAAKRIARSIMCLCIVKLRTLGGYVNT